MRNRIEPEEVARIDLLKQPRARNGAEAEVSAGLAAMIGEAEPRAI